MSQVRTFICLVVMLYKRTIMLCMKKATLASIRLINRSIRTELYPKKRICFGHMINVSTKSVGLTQVCRLDTA